MMKFIIITLFLVVIGLGLHPAGIVHYDFLDSQEEIPEWGMRSVDDFTLKKLDGTSVSLSEFKDKVVLLNFWASWCGPCLKEFPSMLKLIDRYEGKVILLAVSTDEQPEAITGFLKKFESKYKKEMQSPYLQVVWDHDQKLSTNTFNIIRYPETFILDRKHNISKKVVGEVDWDGTEMVSFVEKLINKK